MEKSIQLFDYIFSAGLGISIVMFMLQFTLPQLITAVRAAWNEPMEFEDDNT